MGAAAELERGMIAARLRAGRRRKRERGGYTGGPAVPFGLRVEGEGKDARFVADPQHASTVDTILQLPQFRPHPGRGRAAAQRGGDPVGARWLLARFQRAMRAAASRAAPAIARGRPKSTGFRRRAELRTGARRVLSRRRMGRIARPFYGLDLRR